MCRAGTATDGSGDPAGACESRLFAPEGDVPLFFQIVEDASDRFARAPNHWPHLDGSAFGNDEITSIAGPHPFPQRHQALQTR
jgi:hypothetical protein